MNPAFWLLLLIGAAALWFFLAPAFRVIGSFLMGLYDRARDEMFPGDEDNEI